MIILKSQTQTDCIKTENLSRDFLPVVFSLGGNLIIGPAASWKDIWKMRHEPSAAVSPYY